MGNCEGKIYNIGMGCCVPVLAPIENYYTKWETERYVSGFTYSKEEIDEKTSGRTSGCCITPEEVDEKIFSAKTEIEAEIPSLDGYATEEWVEDKHYLTEHQSLSAYSTTEEMTDAIEVATSGKADTSAVTAVNDALTAHTADTAIHVTANEKSAWDAKSNFSGSYNDLTDKPTIPTVPTNVSAFNNDSGYATSGYVTSSVSGKLDTSVFQAFSGSVNTEIDNKQDISGMTAYTQNDSFTAHTADTAIHVTANEKSTWNNKANVWCGSEAEWSLISGGTLDNNTIYLVY